MYFIHNNFENKCVKNMSKDELDNYLNSGWKEGKCPAHWINNGIENRLLQEGKDLPEGFVYGQSDSFKAKNSASGKRRWKNASKEDRLRWSKSVSIGTKTMWDNISNEEKVLREKHRLETRAQWTDDEILMYSLKMSNSAKKARATRNKEDIKKSCDKGFRTKQERGNSNTSKIEDSLYNFLIESFGVSNIERNYSQDYRYPFHCDFYIKCLDLFIELNAHWTHGGEPFDLNNIKCQEKLELWKEKAKRSQFYENAIKTWTERDVEKQKVARENNLNYTILYSSNDILNFKNKIMEKNLNET